VRRSHRYPNFFRSTGRREARSARNACACARTYAGCKFLRMQMVHREVCKCAEHVRPVFFEPFSARHAEDDRERARYLHILDISSHCIGTIVPWVPASGMGRGYLGAHPRIRAINPNISLNRTGGRIDRLPRVFPGSPLPASQCFHRLRERHLSQMSLRASIVRRALLRQSVVSP